MLNLMITKFEKGTRDKKKVNIRKHKEQEVYVYKLNI